MSWPNSRWLQRVTPIILVALILRLSVAFLLPMPADFEYLSEPGWIAANLVGGRGYTFDFYGTRPDAPLQAFVPPLHPWMMVLALVSPEPGLVLALMQALLGTLTVWLFFRLATRLVGAGPGALAAWGAALYPAHILITTQPISAVLHSCLLVAVLLAGSRLVDSPGAGRAAVAGGLIGLFALSRPQVLFYLLLLLVWLLINSVSGQQLWRLVAVATVIAVAIVLPWVVRNTLVFGEPSLFSTNGGVTFWNGNNPFTTGSGHDVYADKLAAYLGVEPDPNLPEFYEHPEPYPVPPEINPRLATMPEKELDQAFLRAGLDFIRQQPLEWVKLEGRKLISFWWFRPNLGSNPLYRDHWTMLYRVQYACLFILALVGFVISLKWSRRFFLVYATVGLYTAVHLVFHVLTRYRWEIELLLLIFASLTLNMIWQRIIRKPAA